MVMYNTPLWTERERPALRLEDVRGDGRDAQYVSLAPGSGAFGYDFVDFINDECRMPLHEALRSAQDQTDEYLLGCGIDIRRLLQAASLAVGETAYPQHRIVMSDVAQQLPAYQRLKGGPFVPDNIHQANPMQVGSDFSPLLHMVRVCRECTDTADAAYTTEAIAQGVGHALLSPYADVWMAEEATLQSSLPHAVTSGYVYRHQGQEYGQFIQQAAAAKLASEVRQRLGVPAEGASASHPLLAAYSERLRRTPPAMAALALDVVGTQLSAEDVSQLWTDLYDMARDDSRARPRAGVAVLIHQATEGALSLDDFDRMELSTPQVAMRNLERIEAACSVEVLDRPSTALKHASM